MVKATDGTVFLSPLPSVGGGKRKSNLSFEIYPVTTLTLLAVPLFFGLNYSGRSNLNRLGQEEMITFYKFNLSYKFH